MAWPFAKKPRKNKKSQEELDDAVRRNKEASDRLKKALDRLGPAKGVTDLLGG